MIDYEIYYPEFDLIPKRSVAKDFHVKHNRIPNQIRKTASMFHSCPYTGNNCPLEGAHYKAFVVR